MSYRKNSKFKLGGMKGLQKFGWLSAPVKPSSKFWKRLFNKRVRKGLQYKRGNWFEWS